MHTDLMCVVPPLRPSLSPLTSLPPSGFLCASHMFAFTFYAVYLRCVTQRFEAYFVHLIVRFSSWRSNSIAPLYRYWCGSSPDAGGLLSAVLRMTCRAVGWTVKSVKSRFKLAEARENRPFRGMGGPVRNVMCKGM